MQKAIISVRPNSVFTMCDYSTHSQPCRKYKLWQVVFKRSELKENANPIGVVIQIHGRQELRADMYGNVCYSQIRPATYAEIAQYYPDLLGKLVPETYLTEINEVVAHELFANYTIFFEKDGAICSRSWWSETENGKHQFPKTTGKYYLLTDTLKKMDIPYMHVTTYTKNQLAISKN